MMENPTVDPALYEHLRELARIARELGAESIMAIRRPLNAQLQFELPLDQERIRELEASLPNAAEIPVSLTMSTTLTLSQAGVLLVIRFPASDGGERPLEQL